jgi:hypothetical protein
VEAGNDGKLPLKSESMSLHNFETGQMMSREMIGFADPMRLLEIGIILSTIGWRCPKTQSGSGWIEKGIDGEIWISNQIERDLERGLETFERAGGWPQIRMVNFCWPKMMVKTVGKEHQATNLQENDDIDERQGAPSYNLQEGDDIDENCWHTAQHSSERGWVDEDCWLGCPEEPLGSQCNCSEPTLPNLSVRNFRNNWE